MLTTLNPQGIATLKNPTFKRYAQRYVDVRADFDESVASFGLPLAETTCDALLDPRIDDLERRGLKIENNRKSLRVGWISDSCVTCRKGVGTKTYLTSTQCPRDCFFCFNPNQQDYEYYRHHTHDLLAELDADYAAGAPYNDIALTGGEPLLHQDLTLAFFRHARELYPQSRLRLYTSGSYMDDALINDLAALGLDEVRFSVKLDEPQAAQEQTLARLATCVGKIPQVMVEMPVMPHDADAMKALVTRLDGLGCTGINLLELCFPFHNAAAFAKRGYSLKNPIMREYYNWWYAGGLPVAGSEEACLEVLEWALDQSLSIGVHYCSLENKFTGQVYQANLIAQTAFPRATMSQRDYYLKTAKVFGSDVAMVRQVFAKRGIRDYDYDPEDDYLEFPISRLTTLSRALPDVEVGISYMIAEEHGDSLVLRELRVDATTPRRFNARTDL